MLKINTKIRKEKSGFLRLDLKTLRPDSYRDGEFFASLCEIKANVAKKALFLLFIMQTTNGYSCINCNKELQKAIGESIYTNIFTMFSSFIVLSLILVMLIYFALRNYNSTLNQDVNKNAFIPLAASATVLGIGIGGFADGIIFHQILQWHGMLSNKFPPDTLIFKSVNMFWDGIFHLFTLLSTIIGIYLLWKLLKKANINTSGNLLVGGMLAGWGIFNLIEGIINHHILKMHNVLEITSNKNAWNYGFLLFGLLLIIVGWLIINKAKNKKAQFI